MASLYVANTSKQHVEFTYRLPEETNSRFETIRVGAQVRVGGDLARNVIDMIIKQHLPYGLKSVNELPRTRDFVGICYSIDKPVQLNNADFVEETMDNNDKALNDRAEDRREESAATIANEIHNTMEQHGIGVPRAEVEMIEETRGTPKIATGYEVVRNGVNPRHGGKQGRRASRR